MGENIIGKNIVKFRKKIGFSQYDLAKKTGISRRTIAYYEKESNNDFFYKLKIIAKALNITVSDLIEQNKNSSKNELYNLDTRIIKKILKIKKLPIRDQNTIWKYINFMEEKNKQKQLQETKK